MLLFHSCTLSYTKIQDDHLIIEYIILSKSETRCFFKLLLNNNWLGCDFGSFSFEERICV